MEQLDRRLRNAALWASVLVLLGSILATVAAAPTPAATTFTLTGYVDQPGGISAPPVPAGVTVELVSAATGTTYKAVTASGGVFSFTSSSTSDALGPGYWRLVVPTVANVSVSGCGKCAVLPENQNPSFAYYSYTDLTNKDFAATIANVAVYPYNATQNGTVYQGGEPVTGVKVNLLDPNFNGLVLSNTTTNTSGEYTMKVPYGDWVMQSIHVSGSNTWTNTTRDDVTSRKPALLNPVLHGFTVSGWVNSTAGRVPTAGNATLYDPTNGYLYSTTTPAGGYYSLPTYLADFAHGTQTFDVILSSNGYDTTWFPLTVSSAAPLHHNVIVPKLATGSMGVYTTQLNFSGIDTATGKGTLSVSTDAVLGNESVMPYLPNATVGQLWAQLGLDYNHSLSFPEASAAKVEAMLNARGPFFLATQAATSINATTFVALTTPQSIASFHSGCSTTSCGLTSSAGLSYSWAQTYTLNGTLAKGASSYTIDFSFQHPASSSLVYNYSVVLPAGYVLSAHTVAPAHTTLTPTGADNTWGRFTLSSTAWTTASATGKFTIVKAGSVTPIVNVTSTNFAFSSANVLNESQKNYTVVLGVGENATFSAAHSVYESSTNGSLFTWDFGDGHSATTKNETINYTYSVATPITHFWEGGMYNGSLKITTSGGITNETPFHVWVVQSTPTAVISSNTTADEQKTTKPVGGTKYLEFDWNNTIAFNASLSTVAPTKSLLSIASWSLVATKDVKKSANYTVASGAEVGANWSVDFKTIGTGHYIKTDAVVNGTSIPLFGWEYNLTLTVWSAWGSSAKASIAILVVDTQPPVPSFTVLNSAGKAISGSSIVEGPLGYAKIELDAAASSDPHNGSIATYSWNITNGNNTTLAQPIKTVDTVKPYPYFDLAPETHAYTIRLTVTDLAGNKANKTTSLTVSPNTTIRPVMEAKTLTGPTTLTDGKASTFWVNVTVTTGTKAVARNVNVTWYFLSASGSGSKRYISGTPGSTVWYNYSSGSPVATKYVGEYPKLGFNKTVRAEVTFTPGFTGNYVLYANVTASNEYKPDYAGKSNVASVSVTLRANPTTELLEYGGIAAAVILAIAVLIWWTRRPARRGGGRTTGRGGLERGSKKPEADDKDDDDDT